MRHYLCLTSCLLLVQVQKVFLKIGKYTVAQKHANLFFAVWLSSPCNTYMYVLMNHWIATNTTGSNRLKNRQTCSKLHHLYTMCSKCPPPARTKISDVDRLRWCIKNEWTFWITLFVEHVVGDVAPASMCLVFVLERDIFSVWCDLLHIWQFLRQ